MSLLVDDVVVVDGKDRKIMFGELLDYMFGDFVIIVYYLYVSIWCEIISDGGVFVFEIV